MPNEMRDRLVELLANSGCAADADTFAELANHLIENGVIVPPCKVGDTVYLIKFNTAIMCKVEKIYCGIGNYLKLKPCFQPYVGNRTIYYTVAESHFGKTVFLTREAAKKALKECVDNAE